jgi:hypothetical protein
MIFELICIGGTLLSAKLLQVLIEDEKIKK